MATAMFGSRVIARQVSRKSFRRTFNRHIMCLEIVSMQVHPDSIRLFSSNREAMKYTPLLKVYEQYVNEGKYLSDELQKHTAKRMTRLQSALYEYDHEKFIEQLEMLEQYERDNQQLEKSDKQSKYIEQQVPPPTISIPVPRGFYIHGSVGIGKSMLMNTFYNNAPIIKSRKRRIHFHAFLQEIHQRIHTLNKQLLDKHGRSFHVDTSKHMNPIIQIAQQLSKEITLLCIDEFQVNDVADAMILSQFFGELWRCGVVVVATSNRPTQDLYEDGLNRSYFLPFIDLLEKYCIIHHLGDKGQSLDDTTIEGKDYRRIKSGVDNGSVDKQCYFYLSQDESNASEKKLDELFQLYQKDSQHNIDPLTLQVNFQRTISVSRYHSNSIARFTFEELCTKELGSSDYNAIANYFQIVIIEDIPQLSLKYPDRARR